MNDSDRPSASQPSSYSKPGQNGTKTTAGKPARPRTAWTYIKWASACLLCLASVSAGTIAGRFWSNPIIRGMVTEGVKHPWETFVNHGDITKLYTPDKYLPGQHVINVLILGCDHDYSDTKAEPLKNTNGRSDAIMIAHVNFDDQTISVLSIPRDTAVHIEHHGVTKINAAYQFGGPELTQQTIKEVFGIDTDYYVAVNFEGFKQIVDALGGVDVEVHKALNYDDNWGDLHIHLQPGFQHLNGYHAMGYVRMRHSDSDIMRAERQHEFLEAVRGKVTDPRNFQKLPDALNALTDNLRTNLTTEQMLALMNYARSTKKENIQLETLPSFEGPSYVRINVPKSEAVIRRIFFNNDTLASIDINAPDSYVVNSLNHRGRGEERSLRHGKRRINPDTTADPDGNDTPITTDPTTPDGSKGDTGSDSTGDNGGKPDGSDKSDKTNKTEKPEKSDKSDSSSGTDKSKTEDNSGGDKKDGGKDSGDSAGDGQTGNS